MTPKALIIHHTAGNESSAEQLRSVFSSRFGVDYIGYHYAISKSGEIWKDLSDDQVGIHNNEGEYNNSNSLGISLVGNFEEEEPTEAQLNTLSNLVKDLTAKFNIPKDKIFGHRDLKQTACPGNNLYNKKPFIKEADMNQIHEWNIELIRKARQVLFNHIDNVGAEADGKLLDDKFNSGDKYEAGNLIERYVGSAEFKGRWVLKSDVASMVADATSVAQKELQTFKDGEAIRTAAAVKAATKNLIKPEDCPVCPPSEIASMSAGEIIKYGIRKWLGLK